jgi:hypothetical protein
LSPQKKNKKNSDMKKITNNASLGKLAMLFNAIILVLFIISMVCLLKFDKINVKFVKDTPAYKDAETELQDIAKPRREAQANVDYYFEKLEKQKKEEIPADKKKAKEHHEDIVRTEQTLAEKVKILEKIDADIELQKILFEAFKTPYEDLTLKVKSAKSVFSITLWLTILCFAIKVLFFALWNYKNLLNLRITSPWMKKSTAPYWGYLGWLIPGYNLIKPYMVFAEIFSETNYILLDKKVIQKDIDKNADFNLGLWWGLLLVSVVLMTLILKATFFNQGPMYYKLSHQIVAGAAIFFYVLYLLQESFLILRGIKMNQILFENRPKFELQ